MNQIRLKMNPTKMKLIYFGSNKMLGKCHLNSISVSQDIEYSSENIRYLGAWLDNNLNFKCHVQKKCSTAMWNIHKIHQIREFIDADTCNILCCALVLSHLEYSNGILINATNTVLNKLQTIQNIVARLVLKKGNYDSASNCLIELHWLPIRSQIEFKLLCIVYKCLKIGSPVYLTNLLCRNNVVKGLRSEDKYKQLIVPRVSNKTFASRSFSVCGPTLWNSLPN